MSGPQQQPSWRAVQIGPGGVPAEHVGMIGSRTAGSSRSDSARQPDEPSAVFGDFDFDSADDSVGPHRRPSRRSVFGWLAVAVAAAVLVAVLLWTDPGQAPGQTTGALAPGSCLTSSAGRAVVVVDCTAGDVEFVVAATFPDTTESARCGAVSSDLTLVTRDRVVLCLNYRAVVGECLYAGRADSVGKAACRTPGSSSTPTGLFRVIAVLGGTTDTRGCPTGTISSLVHVTTPEVLCLGLP
jgi:hypothetical protein